MTKEFLKPRKVIVYHVPLESIEMKISDKDYLAHLIQKAVRLKEIEQATELRIDIS